MSCVTIYKVLPDGDVEEYADVKNAMAFAPVIWEPFCRMAGGDMFGDMGPVWKLFGTRNLTYAENIVLALTFDGVWVKRHNIPKIIEAVDHFMHRLVKPLGQTPTIYNIVDELKRLWKEPCHTVRGFCLQATSVNENPWKICTNQVALDTAPDFAEDPDEDIDAEYRSFNFDRDKVNGYGAEVFEIIEELDKKLAVR